MILVMGSRLSNAKIFMGACAEEVQTSQANTTLMIAAVKQV